MTPFEHFFETEFPRMLDTIANEPNVLIGNQNITDASWDRKAAYLLWIALGRPVAPVRKATPKILDDLLG